jgi:hypothetical protein
MADRITKQMVVKAVERLMQKFPQGHWAKDHKDAGGWILDYNGIYGGYVIMELLQGGGETGIFGLMRRNAREMYDTISFALEVLRNYDEAWS